MYSFPSLPYICIFLGCYFEESTGKTEANLDILTIFLSLLNVPGTAISRFSESKSFGATFLSS